MTQGNKNEIEKVAFRLVVSKELLIFANTSQDPP